MLPKSRPLAASQNADHPQTDAPKIAGPGIAGPASLYTGTQALSAANPTQMATGIPSSQTMSPIGELTLLFLRHLALLPGDKIGLIPGRLDGLHAVQGWINHEKEDNEPQQ